MTEQKTAKNRCHLDLRAATEAEVDPEVTRLSGLGAQVVRTAQTEYGIYWPTLQDPQGNEFCIGAS